MQGTSPLFREDANMLYEAAMKGELETLNTLLKKDPLILHKASLTSYSETPLHISALMGHLDFTDVILYRHPKMATEPDPCRRFPLHLASAEGHTEVVKVLLRVNKDVCFGCDEDGRIPLHLAAMRGRIGAIRELVSARPESKRVLLDGDTILHLCVRYNHLEALKILVEMMDDDDDELIIQGNRDGNTILHLAAMLKQIGTLQYMLSITKIRTSASGTANHLGLTALEVIEHGGSKDFKSLQIRSILLELAGHDHITTSKTDQKDLRDGDNIDSTLPRKRTRKRTKSKLWFKKLMKHLNYDGNWIEETRGALMVVATVIATISFQVATNPPGGVLQANYTDDCFTNSNNNSNSCQLAGRSVFGYLNKHSYFKLMLFNTVPFFSSIIVIMLVISGFPLHNKFFMWCLTVAMEIAVTFLTITYLYSLDMVKPIYSQNGYAADSDGTEPAGSTILACLVVSIIGALPTIRFLYWVGRNLNNLLGMAIRIYSRIKRWLITSSKHKENQSSTALQELA